MINGSTTQTGCKTALVELGQLGLEGGADPRQLKEAAAALVGAALKVDCVEIVELLRSGDAVRLVASTGRPRASVGDVEQLGDDSPLASEALRGGTPLVISEWHRETSFRQPPELREAGITSSVSVGIGANERVRGFISVHSRQRRIFSNDEVLFLNTVGLLLAYAAVAAQSAESFRVLVENAPDVIVRFIENLHIAYVNPAIQPVSGAAAESFIGKRSRDLGVPERLAPAWELILRQVWRTGRERTFELTLHTPLGERVFASRIVPERGPDGSAASVLGILRDITDLRRAEAERSELQRALMAQQSQWQELMGQLVPAHERTAGQSAARSQLEHLSERERHILRLLTAGLTNRQIGAEIGLATGTVKNAIPRILMKLKVTDRTQAAARAVELGLNQAVWRVVQDTNWT